jgi:hypothetical protein
VIFGDAAPAAVQRRGRAGHAGDHAARLPGQNVARDGLVEVHPDRYAGARIEAHQGPRCSPATTPARRLLAGTPAPTAIAFF